MAAERSSAVHDAFPKLAYCVSDVIVLIGTDALFSVCVPRGYRRGSKQPRVRAFDRHRVSLEHLRSHPPLSHPQRPLLTRPRSHTRSRYLERAIAFASRANDGVQDVELPILLLVSNKRAAEEYRESFEETTTCVCCGVCGARGAGEVTGRGGAAVDVARRRVR